MIISSLLAFLSLLAILSPLPGATTLTTTWRSIQVQLDIQVSKTHLKPARYSGAPGNPKWRHDWHPPRRK
ncbi:hypothetical protein E2C01_094246 [Portunus trituberculatus]|uniref:Uncharacterized protein n=1 Tax=Portunus trituberculatus TaxID=210409 RepID=A0A5B7JLD1_PORTR|nr:hypothetical protein [Portunus trituberculatus]